MKVRIKINEKGVSGNHWWVDGEWLEVQKVDRFGDDEILFQARIDDDSWIYYKDTSHVDSVFDAYDEDIEEELILMRLR